MLVALSFLGPMFAMLLFMFKVTDDCVDSMIGHSVWFGRTLILFFPLKRVTRACKSFRVQLV